MNLKGVVYEMARHMLERGKQGSDQYRSMMPSAKSQKQIHIQNRYVISITLWPESSYRVWH